MARRISQRMSRLDAYAAVLQAASGPLITYPYIYDVAKPVNPTFVQLTGGVDRIAVKFDTGNAYIGTKPREFKFYWKKLNIQT